MMFKRIKDLFMRHKILGVISFLAMIVSLIIIYMVVWMTLSNSNSYGDRLDGINDVIIDDSLLKDVSKKIKDYEEVLKCKARVQGKIVYFDIDYVNGVGRDKAIEIASHALDDFQSEELDFYDFEFVLTLEGTNDASEIIPTYVFGTRKYGSDGISWSKG